MRARFCIVTFEAAAFAFGHHGLLRKVRELDMTVMLPRGCGVMEEAAIEGGLSAATTAEALDAS